MMLPLFLFLLVAISPEHAAAELTRDVFPKGFIFGAGTSAYQVEGAAAEDGRKPSIWDTFTHQGYSPDNATADIAADQYHHYKDDVKLMSEMGLDAYRFSIAWPRLIPDGRGRINPKGLEYYNNLIDELLRHGIQPHITLYHFDLPQSIQDEYNGLLSPRFVEDFTAYADACFRSFGDRVKHWVTMNEPNVETIGGFDTGILPPRRCSYPFGTNCAGGDSTTEPYIAAHHLLLGHASAVSLYRQKYQPNQGGEIGITLMGGWHEPASDTAEDSAAAERMREFHIGWFMHPLTYGDYPPIMRSRVGARLPNFTVEQSRKLSGSCDFIGLTHYEVNRMRADGKAFSSEQRDYYADTATIPYIQEVYIDVNGDRLTISPAITAHYKRVTGRNEHAPWALGKLLEHLKLKYGNPPIMIHENGYADEPETPSKIVYDDDNRSEYLQDYIEVLELSIRNGSNTRGYFVWSFLDLFEILYGYRSRYGICGVDMNSEGRTRYLRNSGRWYSGFLKGRALRLATL